MAFFAQQQHRALVLGKIRVRENVLNELGLAALQKAGKDVYRNGFVSHNLVTSLFVYAEQSSDALLIQLGADDAQTAGVIGSAAADFRVRPERNQSAATRRRLHTERCPLARSTVPSVTSPSA